VFPRSDGVYDDNRHPNEVTRLKSLEEDAKRRDFTMNAMYMDKESNIIDPMNGKQDIEDEAIITCGNATDRFKEDPLRMLRALRFKLQLRFDIVDDCEDAIHSNAQLLEYVSVDRIREELNKMLLKNPLGTVMNLYDYGLIPYIDDKGLTFQMTNKKLKDHVLPFKNDSL
jgi:tRNA nucleotidyltransferase (CCA-adding enzyme)